MTYDELRKEIEDARWFLDKALEELDKEDLDMMASHLETVRCFIEDLIDDLDEDYE